jgi:hypothetical protein
MAEITKCFATYEPDGVHLSIVAFLKYGEEFRQPLEEAEPGRLLTPFEHLSWAVDRYIFGLFDGRTPEPIRLPLLSEQADHNG